MHTRWVGWQWQLVHMCVYAAALRRCCWCWYCCCFQVRLAACRGPEGEQALPVLLVLHHRAMLVVVAGPLAFTARQVRLLCSGPSGVRVMLLYGAALHTLVDNAEHVPASQPAEKAVRQHRAVVRRLLHLVLLHGCY